MESSPKSSASGDHYPDDASGLTLSEDAAPVGKDPKRTHVDTALSDIGEFGSTLCQGSSDMPFAQHTTCTSHSVYASENTCLPASFDLLRMEEIGCDNDPPNRCWIPPPHPKAPLPDQMGCGYPSPPTWYNSVVSGCTSQCGRQLGATCGLLWMPLRSWTLRVRCFL